MGFLSEFAANEVSGQGRQVEGFSLAIDEEFHPGALAELNQAVLIADLKLRLDCSSCRIGTGGGGGNAAQIDGDTEDYDEKACGHGGNGFASRKLKPDKASNRRNHYREYGSYDFGIYSGLGNKPAGDGANGAACDERKQSGPQLAVEFPVSYWGWRICG